MQIDYELNKQDYIDFNIYHFNNSGVLRKSLIYQRFIVPIIFLIIPFILAKLSDIPFLVWFVAFSITTVLWIIFYPKYFTTLTKKRISKMVDEGKNNDLFGKHSLIVDEKGLLEKSRNGENFLKWSGVERIVSTENHLLVYVSSVSAIIIPKRFFDSQNRIDEFYKYINAMIEKSKIEV